MTVESNKKKEMKTIEEFKKAVKEKEITFWPHHPCSICGHVVGYEFHGDDVYFNSGCDCSGRNTLNPRTWEDVANNYNRQRHPDVIKEMNEFFGFN